MRLSSQQDVALAQDEAFRLLLDVAYLERQLLRRGIEVTRLAGPGEPGEGMAWEAGVDLRGQRRAVTGRIDAWEPSAHAGLTAEAGGIDGHLKVEFTALSRSVTRLRVALDIKARGFRDRMLLNALRLSKSHLAQKFEKAVGELARDAERRAVQA